MVGLSVNLFIIKPIGEKQDANVSKICRTKLFEVLHIIYWFSIYISIRLVNTLKCTVCHTAVLIANTHTRIHLYTKIQRETVVKSMVR